MKVLLFLICLLSSYMVSAQNCTCQDLLNEVVSKTENDYAGYIHKVKEKDSSQYVQLKKQLKEEAASTSFLKCYDLLQTYVHFFNDEHLYVGESPPKQPDSLAATVKTYQVPANYEEILNKKTPRDPIEGIWKAADLLQIAIIKTGNNTYNGVIQKTSAPKWAPGMVKMEIEKTNSNEYRVAYYRNDFAKVRFTKLNISKNTVLAFGFYRFSKISPANPESKYIDPTDPQLPIVKSLDKENVLLTIPSALIDGRYLDSILAKNDNIIKSTPNLIIDIRSNGGGNYIWGSIYNIANTIVHPEPQTTMEDDFLLLASEDDANYVYNMSSYLRNVKDSLGIKYYDNLVSKIRNNTGKIIGFSFYSAHSDTATRIVYKYPKRIAVIIDKEVASAGEAFLMGLKETSSKVTFYGTNTHGMIDYMNVNSLLIGDKSCKWYFFSYPTFFAKDIKTKPNNPTGLKPDIYIPLNSPDWVEWVKNDLGSRK